MQQRMWQFTHPLKKIQRCALCNQDGSSGTANLGDDRAAGNGSAIADKNLELEARIHEACDGVRDNSPGDNQRLLRRVVAGGLGIGCDGGARRQVAAAEVFAERRKQRVLQ